MTQIPLAPPDEVPVNAIRPCLDQFALVAATGNGDVASFCGAPPLIDTRRSSQPSSARRLKRTRAPSGEKQGQRSKLSEVMKRADAPSVRHEFTDASECDTGDPQAVSTKAAAVIQGARIGVIINSLLPAIQNDTTFPTCRSKWECLYQPGRG